MPRIPTRPLDVIWDEYNKLILVGNQSDSKGGGSLWTYDPIRGEELWRIQRRGAGVAAMARGGHNVSSLNSRSRMSVVNVVTRQVVHDTEITALSSGSHLSKDEQGNIYTLRGRNLVRLEVLSYPQPDIAVSSRVFGPNTQLHVTVTNAETVPVDVAIISAYGEKVFTNVLPGKNAFHSFTARVQALPAGEVTVHIGVVAGGESILNGQTVSYPGDQPIARWRAQAVTRTPSETGPQR